MKLIKREVKILKKKKIKKYIFAFLIIAVATSAYFILKYIQNNEDDSNIYYGTAEADKINICTEIGGRIKEIKVEEGEKVSEGDLIATIYSDESYLNLQGAEISIKNAENNLAKVKDGNRVEEIKAQEALVKQAQALVKQGEAELESAQNNVSTAQNNYDYKKKTYDTTMALYKNGAESKDNLDKVKNDLDNAESTLANMKAALEAVQSQVDSYKAKLDAAVQKLNLLVNGASEKDINAAEYSVEQAQNNYEMSKLQLDKSKVITFNDGIIESINFNPGEYLTQGSSIATLLDNKDLWIKVYVPESVLPRININKKVVLKSDFLKDKTINGKIIYISPEAEFTPMNVVTKKDRMKLVYEVKIKILDNLDVVKSGMLFSVKL